MMFNKKLVCWSLGMGPLPLGTSGMEKMKIKIEVNDRPRENVSYRMYLRLENVTDPVSVIGVLDWQKCLEM